MYRFAGHTLLLILSLFIFQSCLPEKNEIRWCEDDNGISFFYGKEKVGTLMRFDGLGITSNDVISELDNGIFFVERHYRNTSDSVMENPRLIFDFVRPEAPDYFLIPAVNYNGNKWGDEDNDNKNVFVSGNLSYSYRRTPIPAMTYSEGDAYTVTLWCDSVNLKTGVSCSFIHNNKQSIHRLIVPEEEQPLSNNNWKSFIEGWAHPLKLEVSESYTLRAIIMIDKRRDKRRSLNHALAFIWDRNKKSKSDTIGLERLWNLSCRFAKESLWIEDGIFNGFSIGLWKRGQSFIQRPVLKYEIGWSGQNASLANSLLKNYLFNSDTASLIKGLKTLDTWALHATLENGLFISHFDDIISEQVVATEIDASNLSTAACQYLEAFELAKACGVSKPKYRQIGLDICSFMLGNQEANGRYGRVWNARGECVERDGTVGASLIAAMLKAFQANGQDAYFESAVKAYDFYMGEFIYDGFTTAGALDSKCIDKESASPLLHASIMLYELTHNYEYLANAEDLSWYISTWLWHYSAVFPNDTDMNRLCYDTFASTSVSTLNHYLSPFGLHFVNDWLSLAKYTDDDHWKEKALAVWNNANQLISDGELIIHDLKRPAGAQNEAYFQTYWQNFGTVNDWLVAWPCAFRLEVLRNLDNWNVLAN